MASTSQRTEKRLLPSLLDRLSERSIAEASQATTARGELPERDLEKALLRDLGYLLNTTAISTVENISAWPQIRKSVLNYGIGPFTGKLIENSDLPRIESSIRRAIQCFEPRLKRESIVVSAAADDPDQDHRSVRICISGEWIGETELPPVHIEVLVDTETNRLEVLT